MSSENEEASATPENSKSSGSAVSTKAGSKGEKMQRIVQYAIPAVALLVAIAALVFAMLAGNGSKDSQEQLSKADAKIEALTASLSAAKGEVDQLKALLAQDKALREKTRKEQDELVARIVQNIIPIQTKLKIKPTLNEQLQQPMSAPDIAPAASTHAVPPSAHLVTETTPDSKPSPQAQAVKKAIEQFNK